MLQALKDTSSLSFLEIYHQALNPSFAYEDIVGLYQRIIGKEDCKVRSVLNRALISKSQPMLPWSQSQIQRSSLQLIASNDKWSQQLQASDPEALLVLSRLCAWEDYAGCTKPDEENRRKIFEKITSQENAISEEEEDSSFTSCYQQVCDLALQRLKTHSPLLSLVLKNIFNN